MAKMEHEESKETPEMEAKYHSKGFLNKAARLAERKLGSRRDSAKKKSSKKRSRKRV